MMSQKVGLEQDSVLIVAAQPTAGALVEQCARYGRRAVAAGLCSEAVAALRTGDPAIVLTQDDLPDGSWRDVFESAIAIRPEAVRVVCSGRSTLRLWLDVFAEGGYDLLPEPCPDEFIEGMFHRLGRTRARERTAFRPARARMQLRKRALRTVTISDIS